MWFIIILIIVTVIVVISKRSAAKAEAERLERERIERQKKAVAEAKARKAKFEVITDAEKQRLSAYGGDALSTTLKAFNKATNGDAGAMLLMGITYRTQLKNPGKAIYWLQKAANKGSPEGLYVLAECYMSGYGVPQDNMKGVSLIMDAAEKGSKAAIELLKEKGMSEAEMRSCGIPV